jgi:hypothetical protein
MPSLLFNALLDRGVIAPDWPLATKAAIACGVTFTSAFVRTPAEIIALRLVIQRIHATDGPTGNDGERDIVDVSEYAGIAEDVIRCVESLYTGCAVIKCSYSGSFEFTRLRSEDDPYHGIVDCGRRIKEEEGLSKLFCVWWIALTPVISTHMFL